MRVLIEIFCPNNQVVRADYKVIQTYEDGSVSALPIGDSFLMRQCNGKPTLFHLSQIKGYIVERNDIVAPLTEEEKLKIRTYSISPDDITENDLLKPGNMVQELTDLMLEDVEKILKRADVVWTDDKDFNRRVIRSRNKLAPLTETEKAMITEIWSRQRIPMDLTFEEA